MRNKYCKLCQGTGAVNNGYFNYSCPCSHTGMVGTVVSEINGTIFDGKSPNQNWLDVNNKRDKLCEAVIKFMKNNGITCEETIYQTDRVIENAYEFIGELFNIVKADLDIEEEDE